MRDDSKELLVSYEISSLAQKLEKELNIKWGFNALTPFDNLYKLRACTESTISILPNTSVIIPTGIYLFLSSPRFNTVIQPYTDLFFNKKLFTLTSIFDYNYRNELMVFMCSYNNEEQLINPGDAIANIQFTGSINIEFNKVTQIPPNEGDIKTKDSQWVQEEKRIKNIEQSSNITHTSYPQTPKYSKNSIQKIIEDRLK